MKGLHKITILNYVLLSIAIFLSVGYFTIPCYFVFGYGLGDFIYTIPLLITTLLLFLLGIFFKDKVKSNISIPIIFGIILLFFIWTLVFNKGPEAPCV